MNPLPRRLFPLIHPIMILAGLAWGASASPWAGLAVLVSLSLLVFVALE